MGDYIVDFYCYQAKLAVELDSSQHYTPEEMKKEEARTAYLEQQGVKIIRFYNLDVMRRFRSVCEAIDMEVTERKQSSTEGSFPLKSDPIYPQ